MHIILEAIFMNYNHNHNKTIFVIRNFTLFYLFFLLVFQGFSSVFYYSHGFGTKATRSNSTEESYKERFTVGQRLDRRWLRKRD